MKSITQISASFFLSVPLLIALSDASAQGGMGKMPRADVVMLRAAVRDSLMLELDAQIAALRRFAQSNNIDSAALIIAADGKTDPAAKWKRAITLDHSEEKNRAESLLAKIQKIYPEGAESHQDYYAVFKDKDNPSGQMHFYQFTIVNGGKKQSVRYTFYPIGGVLMLGDVN